MLKYQLSQSEYKSQLKEYRKKVQKITSTQPLYQLLDYDKRGMGKYHLDHILSVAYGFNEGIDPEVIGDIRNLRFIPYKSNLEKKDFMDKASWDVYFMMIDEGMI